MNIHHLCHLSHPYQQKPDHEINDHGVDDCGVDEHLTAQIVDGVVDLLFCDDEVTFQIDEVVDEEVEVVGKKSDFFK